LRDEARLGSTERLPRSRHSSSFGGGGGRADIDGSSCFSSHCRVACPAPRTSFGRTRVPSVDAKRERASPIPSARAGARAGFARRRAVRLPGDPRAASAAPLARAFAAPDADARIGGHGRVDPGIVRRRAATAARARRSATAARARRSATAALTYRARITDGASLRSHCLDWNAASEVWWQPVDLSASVVGAPAISRRMTCLDPDAASGAFGGLAGREAGEGVVEPNVQSPAADVSRSAVFRTVAGDGDHAAAHAAGVVVAARRRIRCIGEDAAEVAQPIEGAAVTRRSAASLSARAAGRHERRAPPVYAPGLPALEASIAEKRRTYSALPRREAAGDLAEHIRVRRFGTCRFAAGHARAGRRPTVDEVHALRLRRSGVGSRRRNRVRARRKQQGESDRPRRRARH
jgi:hypothetical protein